MGKRLHSTRLLDMAALMDPCYRSGTAPSQGLPLKARMNKDHRQAGDGIPKFLEFQIARRI
jgi:hypothetical protein